MNSPKTLDDLVKLFPHYSIHFTPIGGNERWEAHFHKGPWDTEVHLRHRDTFIGTRNKKENFSTLEEAIAFVVATYMLKPEKQESIPMKITLNKEDLKQALQIYLNAQVVREPVVVDEIYVRNIEQAGGGQQFFDLEITLRPAEKETYGNGDA